MIAQETPLHATIGIPTRLSRLDHNLQINLMLRVFEEYAAHCTLHTAHCTLHTAVRVGVRSTHFVVLPPSSTMRQRNLLVHRHRTNFCARAGNGIGRRRRIHQEQTNCEQTKHVWEVEGFIG